MKLLNGSFLGSFFFILFAAFFRLAAADTYAELKTVDGAIYKNCTVTKSVPDGITITYDGGMAKIPFTKLSPEIQKKYNYDPAEADKYAAEQASKQQAVLEAKRKSDEVIAAAAQDKETAEKTPTELPKPTSQTYMYEPYDPILKRALNPSLKSMLQKTDAFTLRQLEDAKKKAIEEHKPLGFMMMWETFFGVKGNPTKGSGPSASIHFYNAFNNQLVLIFVMHENELDLVPDAVKEGFFGPDEGGFAPNMCVTDPTAKIYVCEIPYGGQGSNGEIRTKLFRDGYEKIRAAQAKWDAAAAANGSP